MATDARPETVGSDERDDLACCERMAVVFRALGNATRLGILRRIIDEGMRVSDLQDTLGCSQPNVSQHLGVLRDRGVVSSRRDGNRVTYALADARIADLLLLAEEIFEHHHD